MPVVLPVQIYVAMVLTTIYALVQGVVLVAIISVMAEEGTCSSTFIFFFFVFGVFLLAAIIHPTVGKSFTH